MAKIAKIQLTLDLSEDEDWLNDFMEISELGQRTADGDWDNDSVHDAVAQELETKPAEFLKQFDDVAPFTVEVFDG